jgi:CRISPR/Cas system-associated protein Cas5 (RAMP superfamily)
MKHGKACIVFELDGVRYEYDGGLPESVMERSKHLLRADGFWIIGYPESLGAEAKDELDDLPSALWDIRRVGATVIEVQGARANGAIHWEDWKHPRIY